MKNLILLTLTLSFQFAHAAPKCSPWIATESISCIHGGEWAQVWTRKCAPICETKPTGEVLCQNERICLLEDPNQLPGPCSEWREVRNTTCYNRQHGRFEQKWIRACQVSLPEFKCSDVEHD